VRMALGATAGDVLRGVALPGLRPVIAGTMIGIASGAGLSGFLHSTLTSPEMNDFPMAFPTTIRGYLAGSHALLRLSRCWRASLL